jgi:prophage antirepressor
MYMNSTINPQATGLQVFYNENENVSIRTDVINGEPWFVAKDVAMALDIDWSGKTLNSIPEAWKGMGRFPINGSEGGISNIRKMIFINESAMYKLAFRSNKPEADRFVNWIAGDVLPSIRRTGSYSSTGLRPEGHPERAKLPLPKHRPFFDNWKDYVHPYLSSMEGLAVAKKLDVSYSHVRKVFMGTSVSERVARALTELAMENKRAGIKYEKRLPVYEQLSIEWERKATEC